MTRINRFIPDFREIGTFVTTGTKVIFVVMANYCLQLPLKLLLNSRVMQYVRF